MRITAKHYKKLLNIVRVLHEHTDEQEMRRHLAEPLLDVMSADYFASFCWEPEKGRYDQGVYLNMDDQNIDKYVQYFQFRDPITRKLAQRRRATRVDEIIEFKHLSRTEFFNDFLLADGLYHGVNLHIYDGDRNIGDLRIWRKRCRESFDESANLILDLLKPHMVQAIHNIRRLRACHKHPEQATIEDKCTHLKHRLVLTDREVEITRLLLEGECDNTIANRLNISVATVRTHVKHVFAKAGVHNRSKLQSIAC